MELLEPLLLLDDESERADKLEVIGQQIREGVEVAVCLGSGELLQELAELVGGQRDCLLVVSGHRMTPLTGYRESPQ